MCYDFVSFFFMLGVTVILLCGVGITGFCTWLLTGSTILIRQSSYPIIYTFLVLGICFIVISIQGLRACSIKSKSSLIFFSVLMILLMVGEAIAVYFLLALANQKSVTTQFSDYGNLAGNVVNQFGSNTEEALNNFKEAATKGNQIAQINDFLENNGQLLCFVVLAYVVIQICVTILSTVLACSVKSRNAAYNNININKDGQPLYQA